LQVFRIPCKLNVLSMVVLLPEKADRIVGLEKKLSAAIFELWRKKMAQHEVDLKLPEFKFTTDLNLSKTLAAMGMPLAFTPGKADFSGMSTQADLYIQQVLHVRGRT
jgi:serpin B